MSTFYEVMSGGDSNTYNTLREAMKVAREWAEYEGDVTVSKIKTPRLTKDLFLRVINGGGYVIDRKHIVDFEDGKPVRAIP